MYLLLNCLSGEKKGSKGKKFLSLSVPGLVSKKKVLSVSGEAGSHTPGHQGPPQSWGGGGGAGGEVQCTAHGASYLTVVFWGIGLKWGKLSVGAPQILLVLVLLFF